MAATSSPSEQAARILELGYHFDELAELLMSARSGPPDPERVVRFAARAVPNTQHSALTLVHKAGRPVTVAATGAVSRRVDDIQYETSQGPCLEAVDGHDVVRAPDLATDRQWPEFARRCVAETEIRSMFSLRLFLSGDDRAALNFYAERPEVFDEMDVAVGAMFAPFAALAVQNDQQAHEIDNLQTALQASRRIGVAIGILMARHLVTYEQAFAMLVAASHQLNRKLRDIAAEVAETGDLPDGGAGGPRD
jgi:ANTAR domain/GAF domain